MFNTSRASSSLMASSLISSNEGRFADPLAAGGFGEVDPWSETATPARISSPGSGLGMPPAASETPTPPAATSTNGFSALDAFIEDPPMMYLSIMDQLDPSHSGEVSLPTLQRMLSTARLPAATVEKIVHLTAKDKPLLKRKDVFCTLAFVALAQSHPASELSLSALDESVSSLPRPQVEVTAAATAAVVASGPANDAAATSATLDTVNVRPPPPAHMASVSSTYSPWDTAPSPQPYQAETNGYNSNAANPDADAERGYWRRVENVQVTLVTEKEGWFLQKYAVISDKRPDTLSRRYSDFVWLNHTLLQRYPFRLLPALPPKRLGPDAAFLEQRRKGLQRYLNALVNHPVVRDDGALNVFMTELNFEAWRKRVKVSTEEEASSKRLTAAQEMSIPADLPDKLKVLHDRIPGLIASYQKMVMLAERELHRLHMSAAEATRMALSLQAIAEDMPGACHRCVPGGKCCDLCQGVGRGLDNVGDGWLRLAEQRERETQSVSEGIEAIKAQRDLYIAFRDLFLRHERLSRDSVDSLRRNVEGKQGKIEHLRSAQKPGWEEEVHKLVSAIEQDNTTIGNLLARRVFIRACMWHELAVVLHSRQAAAATLGWRAWVAGEGAGARAEAAVWDRLADELEAMPLE